MDKSVLGGEYLQGSLRDKPKKIEAIRMYRIDGARGETVAMDSYLTMANAILSFFKDKESGLLLDLISHVEKLNITLSFNLYTKLLLLQVKQDLEHKGLLKTYLHDVSPFIRLSESALNKSEFKKTLKS